MLWSAMGHFHTINTPVTPLGWWVVGKQTLFEMLAQVSKQCSQLLSLGTSGNYVKANSDPHAHLTFLGY